VDLKGKKIVGLYLHSKVLNLVGRIDEAIDTGQELILIERKYSDSAIIGATLKVQLGLLALLLEENFSKPVLRARVIFSKNDCVEFEVLIDTTIRDLALKMLYETMETVVSGREPRERPDRRCLNCCFRKICPVGSLYTPQ
jgi:CRISPR-associated exonuclease Cas4